MLALFSKISLILQVYLTVLYILINLQGDPKVTAHFQIITYMIFSYDFAFNLITLRAYSETHTQML